MRQHYALFLLFWTPVILSMDSNALPKPPVSSPRATERKNSGEKALPASTPRTNWLHSATSAFKSLTDTITPQPARARTTSMCVHDGSESDSSDNESEKDPEKKESPVEGVFSRPASPDAESKDY